MSILHQQRSAATPPLGSVSQLIAEAKDGDERALAELHRRYWPKLVKTARSKLNGAPIRARDAEDVAQATFIALYQSLTHGRLPDLGNRQQLLAFMSHLVACQAINEIKHELTQKAGAGQVQNISPQALLAEGDHYTPPQEAILNDCYDFYINRLPDKLRPFAELHLAGFTNAEISEQMNCVERTVERKLSLLRRHWQELASDSFTKDMRELLAQR